MTSTTHSFVAKQSVVSATLDDEMILLDLESGIYFGLNDVGARIWSLLASGSSETTIFETLCSEYDADANELRADVSEFLGLLQENNLITATE